MTEDAAPPIFDESEPLPGVEAEELDTICNKAFELREQLDEINEKEKTIKEELAGLERRMLSYLDHYQKTKHYSSKGLIYQTLEMNTKVVDKKAFAKYLADKGVLEEFQTFNAMKVKGLCKGEIEVAENEKRIFNIPGVAAPEYFAKVKFKKGKEK